METFAKRLKLAMDMRGKKAIEVADGCHISRGIVSLYLNGKRQPKQKQVLKIAEYLNVLPTYLMGWGDQMSAYEGKQFVALTDEAKEEVILIREIISEIQAICSYESVDNLKVILNVVKTLARHGK